MMVICKICASENVEMVTDGANGVHSINCPKCGKFKIVETGWDDITSHFTSPDELHLLSHEIRKSQINNSMPFWDIERCEKVRSEKRLPSYAEQMNGVIEWVGDNTAYPGKEVDLSQPAIFGITGVQNQDALLFFLESLSEDGLLSYGYLSIDGSITVVLTLSGFEKYDAIIKGKNSYDKVFMAMQFGDAQLNQVLNECFKPAVEQTGFKLVKLDDQPQAGLIDIRMRQEIKTSKFMIADLTHENLGAYWESGYAEGLGKQVIYTCNKDKFEKAKTHFDVNHHLTIMWDKDNLDAAAEDLKAAIRFTFPDAKQVDD